MAAETTGVGVVTILFFDAPQPIKNFLFNTNESRVKNEERRKMAFFFLVLRFILFLAEQKKPAERLFALSMFLLMKNLIWVNNHVFHSKFN